MKTPAPPRARRPATANTARSQPAAAESGRVYGGASHAERAAQRRAQFLDAGLGLFGTQGFRATTVRALCARAGLTDRYFYESFDDLEALLMAVYAECTGRLQGALLASLAENATAPAATLVHDALDAFFRVVEEDPRVARIVWLEVLGVSPAIDRLYNRQVSHFASLVDGMTQRVIPGLALPAAERDAMSIALVGAVSQSTMHWLLTGFRLPRRVLVEANTRLVLGLIATLGPRVASPKPRRKSP